MRILVMSDSHGNEKNVFRAIEQQPNASVIIHLGDGEREAMAVMAAYRDRAVYTVRGNCDYGGQAPVHQTVSIGGKRLYLTHGYTERVKTGLLNLALTAGEAEAAAALYGHTHIPLIEYRDGMLLFNPGSIGYYDATYGILDMDANGILPTIVPLS